MLTVSPGDQLLHYRLIRKIGEGGMGVVFEAEDVRLGRTVAIKLLQPSISGNPDVRQRFLREARAASAIDHPNLCTIYTVEELPDGALLLVMARYTGQTVAELIQRSGRLDVERIRDVGHQAAAGLHAAHMSGIIHRDIKPGNLFLLNSGIVKILDFGLSRVADQSQLTRPHQVMGTLAYMSPEQLSGTEIDHRSDIWALGAVIYEMATGYSPFHKSSSSATIAAISECRYVPLHRVRTDLPKSILAAVEGALRLSHQERHSSAAILRDLLKDSSAAIPVNGNEPPGLQETSMSVSDSSSAQFAPTELVIPQSSSNAGYSPSISTVSGTQGGTAIAVLPLRNVSPDPENEYFSDGLTDELISSLGNIAGLRVVSRTSAFSFKGTTKTIQEIGEALNVTAILEGSVRRSGKRVRVTTQLTQVSDGFPLWSERFDREMADVFELQEELAAAVVSALSENRALDLHLSHIQFRTPMQADAYEAYLKGRYHWSQRTLEDNKQAGRYFERALQLDPNSAAAHAGMADFYVLQGQFGGMPQKEAWDNARSLALQTIALDPTLPEGHLALASVFHFYDWDWEGARQHFVKAIELQPQRGESYYMYTAHLISQGQLEEALKQVRKGLKYDPLSAPLLAEEALIHNYLGNYDNSILLAQSALQSAPHYVELYYALGMAQTFAGRPQEGVKTFERGLENTQSPFLKGWLVEALVKSGNVEKAREIYNELLQLAEMGHPMQTPLAVAAAALGEKDAAFQWIEQAIEKRDILIGYVAVYPSLRTLHGEPRFKELLERMKIPHPSTHRRRHEAG